MGGPKINSRRWLVRIDRTDGTLNRRQRIQRIPFKENRNINSKGNFELVIRVPFTSHYTNYLIMIDGLLSNWFDGINLSLIHI